MNLDIEKLKIAVRAALDDYIWDTYGEVTDDEAESITFSDGELIDGIRLILNFGRNLKNVLRHVFNQVKNFDFNLVTTKQGREASQT